MLPFDTDNKKAGYRLNYMQVYNWGLYNDEVFTISPEFNSSLLIGANASGKTTLVDALLTLFLSNPKYNLAGDSLKKNDRDITTYILGHYTEFTNDKGEIVPESLRKKDDYSLILASFYNEGLKSNITIGQFFWFKTLDSRRPERLYFISYNKKIKIEEDLFLNELSGVSEFKKRLERLKILSDGKKVPNREGLFTDKYTLYSDNFATIFGLKNKGKALNLFNQTVSLKNIGNLNNFIKNEMLDFVNIEPSIKKIKQAFDEAKQFSDEIELTERKIKLIEPIINKGKNYISLERELTEAKNSLSVINSFFATLKKTLLSNENELKEKEKEELDKLFAFKFSEGCGELFDNKKNQKKIDEEIIVLKSETGITTILGNIELSRTKVKPVEKKYGEYKQAIEGILPLPEDEKNFIKNKEQLIIKKRNCEAEQVKLESERDDFLIKEISPLQNESDKVKEEIERLKKNKTSLIEKRFEDARTVLCSELGIEKMEIPFVCELVKIKDDSKKWQNAIERLLHDFGLTMLVEEKYYDKVCNYVDGNDFDKIKLIFHKLPQSIDVIETSKNNTGLFDKIELSPKCKDIHKEWVTYILSSQFNLVFCDNINQFHSNKSAITINGLIKNNDFLHVKNCNVSIDSTGYILGWDNTEKIKELTLLKSKLKAKLQTKEEEKQRFKSLIDSIEDLNTKISSLLNIESFSEIDFISINKEIESQELKLKSLEKNEELNSLIQKSLSLKVAIAELEEEKQALSNKVTALETQIKTNEEEQGDCQKEIETVSLEEQNEFYPLLRDQIVKVLNHSSEITGIKASLETKLRETERNLKEPVSSLKKEIEDTMLSFKLVFADDMKREELRNDIEYISEFSTYYQKLKEDSLTTLKDKFDEKLRTRSDRVIADFWQKLNTEKTIIENKTGRNGRINELLKKRHYQENKSFLQIIPNETRDEEIKNFKNEVRSCFYPIGGGVSAEEKLKRNKVIFQNIKSLLEKLEKYNMPGDRWANKVTDVRNWFDFTASEIDINNPLNEIKAHSGTSSKSGGETFKITYTILASAIADEFGLVGNQIQTNSLRFIVIDEIFNNLGVKWSEYVLKMFEDMDLQLLIVSPDSLEKANIAKDHIKNVHWTYKDIVMDGNRETDNSYVVDITFDKLTEKVYD
jgi:uncharacterized protein YPO0396